MTEPTQADMERARTWCDGEGWNAASVGKLIAQVRAETLRDVLLRVNAAAEADMLAGNPVTGAHHRAIERELEKLK